MLFAAQIGGVAGRVVLARWSDRLRSGRLVAVLLAMAAAATGSFVLAVLPGETPLAMLYAVAVALGFATFGWYGPWVVYVAETASGRAVGLTLALAMTANQLGLIAAPPLFGLIVDLADANYRPAWLALAVVLLLATLRTLAGSRPRVASGSRVR